MFMFVWVILFNKLRILNLVFVLYFYIILHSIVDCFSFVNNNLIEKD